MGKTRLPAHGFGSRQEFCAAESLPAIGGAGQSPVSWKNTGNRPIYLPRSALDGPLALKLNSRVRALLREGVTDSATDGAVYPLHEIERFFLSWPCDGHHKFCF